MDWLAVRPELTQRVFGKTLLDRGTKVVLTRVAPGGSFESHRDGYHHLFYFLSGRGELRIEDKTYAIRPGLVAKIEAGEAHSYRNTGEEEMLLLSLNLPIGKEEKGK